MLGKTNVDWNTVLNNYLDRILEMAGNIVVAILIIVIGFKLIKMLIRFLKTALEKGDIDYGVISFSCSFVKIALRVLVILAAVDHVGVKTSSFIALLGSAGVAVGLALQGSLSNIAGGVLLLILKPFQVGDYIVLEGTMCEGEVAAMDIYYTKLKTIDNRVIVIPNGTLTNSNLINNTKQDKRLIDITVGVSYDADIKKVKEILGEITAKEKSILDQEGVKIFVSSLADSAVMMGIRCWVSTDEYVGAKWRLNEDIKLSFDREGIEIPYQKLDVCIKSEDDTPGKIEAEA
ncbi:MAG TPA: mechanosensitive ion channel [Candidatus Anaerostipes avistercoris]|uniref:Mechanosensitive ion channel n=1 Tax=Candidatus Anaerostipes avistercoris TaxID=2838462 RepID=A0A9D2T809_9FIRM|nr:mechanosensitive ion channel domain-containing protein [uncultured Anaerostipes sp.]HJC49857.1 mechanosensitive ion channel [Candidatus Anaerostipes avistercoris]